MPIDLNAPLNWTNASPLEHSMLKDLQGNILKGHGRSHTENIFLRFDRDRMDDSRAFLRGLAPSVTSAIEQLQDAQRLSDVTTAPLTVSSIENKLFVTIVLSAAGYRALGVQDQQIPSDEEFRAGQKSSATGLADPAPNTWEPLFRQELHALLLIAGPSESAVRARREEIVRGKPDAVALVGIEIGLAMHNTRKHGIEHFGYVDGRSQPLFLTEDIAKESSTDNWSPAFPLKQVLVPCPGGSQESGFGSYFVFRKLEQNVQGFHERLEELATRLGLVGQDRKRAGAMAVGRFEDGTPLVLRSTGAAADGPTPNDFNFLGDPSGSKCPFHSHIRKTNPRGESGPPSERDHIMARRGIPYGKRDAELDDEGRIIRFNDEPSRGVGLLFMAYQANISEQFEFTQRFWSNNPNFLKPNTGLDPLTGQGPSTDQEWPLEWGDEQTRSFSLSGFVSMRGGEYFFAPCITFFNRL